MHYPSHPSLLKEHAIDISNSFKIIGAGHIPLLLHIPHSSTKIPEELRGQFVLSDEELAAEVLAMTDAYTNELFLMAARLGARLAINLMSRLVMDPERFSDDSQEQMSKKGMGAVYLKSQNGKPLRNGDFSTADRQAIMDKYYQPYHQAIEEQVTWMLDKFDRCFIVDGHSFPKRPYRYEDATLSRPDICLGYDKHHAPDKNLLDQLEAICDKASLEVSHNQPFAGSYVPIQYYREDARVKSLMIEVNRSLYMEEATGEKSSGYDRTANVVGEMLERISSDL